LESAPYIPPEETGFYGADDKIFVLAVKKSYAKDHFYFLFMLLICFPANFKLWIVYAHSRQFVIFYGFIFFAFLTISFFFSHLCKRFLGVVPHKINQLRSGTLDANYLSKTR